MVARLGLLPAVLLLALSALAMPVRAQGQAAPAPAPNREIATLRRVVRRLREGHQALYRRVEQLEASAAGAETRQRAMQEGSARLRREAEQSRLLALAGVAVGLVGLLAALAALKRRGGGARPAQEISLEPLRERLRAAETRLRSLEQESAGLPGERGT
ncbi:MAG: hypothetical protein ACK47B_15225 [Armatimonadota bacterium]